MREGPAMNLQQGVKKSWLVPGLYTLVSILLAWGVDRVDRLLEDGVDLGIPAILLTRVDLAAKILSSITTALLTMTTLTFSVIMLVLTTYTSQYSPRTLSSFITDRVTLRVQGIFIGGFVYSIVSLLFMKRSTEDQMVVSGAVGVLLSFVCLAFFLQFIHHVGSSIQVNHLVPRLTKDAKRTIDHLTELADTNGGWSKVEFKEKKLVWIIPAQNEGYVQSIKIKQMVKLAKRKDVQLELIPGIGEFVLCDEPLLRLSGNAALSGGDASWLKLVTMDQSRTRNQDVEYSVQRIVDVILRAISTGINDPNTAIYGIRQLGRVLAYMKRLPSSSLVYRDDQGKARLVLKCPRYADLLYKSFSPIRQYASQDLMVMAAILENMTLLVRENKGRWSQELREAADDVYDQLKLEGRKGWDRDYLEQCWRQFHAELDHYKGKM